MHESNTRSLAKAISWRITGTVDTFIISFFVTGEITLAGAIAVTEVVTKIFLYWAHERVWNKISYGKEEKQ